MNRSDIRSLLAAVLLLAGPCFAAGTLEVRDGWIRSAPPGASMLAGYATLHNAGDHALTIRKATAAGFADTSLHESVLVGDVSRMQALGDVTIAAGASVTFQPGGKHIMLVDPASSPRPGDTVDIRFDLADGSSQSATFTVRDEPATPTDPHAGHDHHH